jgi:hypothetical protein
MAVMLVIHYLYYFLPVGEVGDFAYLINKPLRAREKKRGWQITNITAITNGRAYRLPALKQVLLMVTARPR